MLLLRIYTTRRDAPLGVAAGGSGTGLAMGSAGVVVKSQLLMGLRGVGKTVLLNRIGELK